MVGAYNAPDAVCCIYYATTMRGVSSPIAARAIARFERVRRRQEDCAALMVGALPLLRTSPITRPQCAKRWRRWPKPTQVGQSGPSGALNTSRRMVFREEYLAAFDAARRVTIAEVESRTIDVGQSLLDVKELAHSLEARGVRADTQPNATAISQTLSRSQCRNRRGRYVEWLLWRPYRYLGKPL